MSHTSPLTINETLRKWRTSTGFTSALMQQSFPAHPYPTLCKGRSNQDLFFSASFSNPILFTPQCNFFSTAFFLQFKVCNSKDSSPFLVQHWPGGHMPLKISTGIPCCQWCIRIRVHILHFYDLSVTYGLHLFPLLRYVHILCDWVNKL
jgi:hypothetical protein